MVLKFLIPQKYVKHTCLDKKGNNVTTNGRNFLYKFFVDF